MRVHGRAGALPLHEIVAQRVAAAVLERLATVDRRGIHVQQRARRRDRRLSPLWAALQQPLDPRRAFSMQHSWLSLGTAFCAMKPERGVWVQARTTQY